MPSLKDVKIKIQGVRKTSQITKAMNMVSSAKLRGAQAKMETFRPYATKFHEAMANLSARAKMTDSPLMEERPLQNAELIVVTSDRGLCGSFNSNILKIAEKKIADYEAAGHGVSIVCIGKRACQYFRKTGKIRKQYPDVMGGFQMFNAREIAADVAANYLDLKADKVDIIYGRFVSVSVQEATSEDFLPVKPLETETTAEPEEASGEYIYEPSSEEIMEVLQPLYLNVMVYHAMLEVGASEHAARMTAMDNATKACKDIVDHLTITYNKARQAAVTNELIDIVGGAEALR